ncbi:MAG: cytochrome C [Cereibacter sphaeroides]|uniref:Cytochrome C n=1 Tax=Cereibacter sphaeroides TaxID=1063 RepID=A0A2W5UFY7_CERSP|nr:MAG: cytochrome C [Cereibacter sphaeroides]
MRPAMILLPIVLLAAPAFAQDAAKGEADFRKCRACHSITAPDGTQIVKGGKTGPDLYGVIGRPVGSAAGFNYGPGLVEAGAAGVVWDEAGLAEYVADPTAWIKKVTNDSAARSKMTFKLAKGGADMAAYLASVPNAAP